MADGMHIDVASLKNLQVNIRFFEGYVLGKAQKGLRAFGLRIVAEAKRIIKDNGSIAQGYLRNSGRAVAQPDGTVDAGFYVGYAYWVENGRKKGKMPPVDVLYQWIVRKRIQPSGKGDIDKLRWDMARNIAWYLKNHDTEGRPFLRPAYEKYRIRIGDFMQKQIDEAVEHFKMKK